jgi:hypothetical protein
LGPLYKEPYSLVVGKTLHRRWSPGVRQGEGRYRILILSIEPQGYATRGQYLQVRSDRKQLGNHRRYLKDLLEVVKHQEHALLAQVVLKVLQEGLSAHLLHPERPSHGRDH